MVQSHADIYRRSLEELMQGRSDTMNAALADDVVWHEAGNPQVLRGKQAVLERFSAMQGAAPDVQIKSSLADDDYLSIFGHAKFQQGGQTCEYDYVEELQFRGDKIVERWSFMDAVPADVDQFFRNMQPAGS
jgi:predicted SnoaL-like aldol condensation-catalyzing enzyme